MQVQFGTIGMASENQNAGHPGLSSGHTGGHLQLELPLAYLAGEISPRKMMWSACHSR